MASNPLLLPASLAFFAALLWGIWWIPIRYLETLGLEGAWASVAMNAGAAIAVFIWMALRRVPLRFSTRGVVGAALVGWAITSYSVAITMSDVVRVVLLFYLAPAWSKVIEWAFMGQRWRWSSTVAVLVSLTGAYFILGGEIALGAIGFGDVLAISAGIAWAGGAALIFTGGPMHPINLTFVTALAATLLGLGFLLAGGGASLPDSVAGASLGGAIGLVYVLPIIFLTLWSAQRLTPAVITFLLTAEILSGVITGALFLDEPFGPMQLAGTVLILSAAAAEVIPTLMRKPA